MTFVRHHILLVLSCLFVAVVLPLFVCMPINSDTALYDLQARSVLEGNVAYRDIVEPNLPGSLWLHLVVRPWIGWSSEAIRWVDALIVLSIASLLFRLLKQNSDTDHRPSVLMVIVAMLFYVTRNEWCHCQRDTWMLLPVAAALNVRMMSWQRWKFQAVVEGVCWALAFWMKPHVAIPALAVMGMDARMQKDSRRSFLQFAFVISGGLLAAVPGILWLVSTGAWADFWEIMVHWNPEYLQAGKAAKSFQRLSLMMIRFSPWWTLHLLAVPASIYVIVKVWRHQNGERSRVMLTTTYLAWFIQALWLQHMFDYVQVPALLLAIAVVGSIPWTIEASFQRFALAGFLGVAVLTTPTTANLPLVLRCLQEGSTVPIKAKLAHGNFPAWNDINNVAEYLKQQNVGDHQLTSLNVHSVHLFNELKVLPSTRYWCTSILTQVFPSHKQLILNAVRESGHRFVVTEANESGLENAKSLPDQFPWNLPVVFQSGTYRVHKCETPSASRFMQTTVH